MTVTSAQFAVTTTAVKVVTAAAGNVEAFIEVSTGTGPDSVYLGGSNAVTTATGFRLENTDNVFRMNLAATDDVWAISTGLKPVHVLVRGA